MKAEYYFFLFKYRNTPCTVTWVTPASIVFVFKPLTVMSKFNKHKIINTQSQKITKNNINQMKYKQNSKLNLKPTIKDINYKYKIDLEQLVWYINLKSSDSKWTKNVIEKRQSKFIYIIIPLEEDASWRI